MDNEQLLEIAKTVELPSWATHAAIRTDGSKSEPSVWVEALCDFLDEDPTELDVNCWAGSYKHYYWKFYSRADLEANNG